MKKVIFTTLALVFVLAMANTVLASRWDLILNDGSREFHLRQVDTVGDIVVYQGRVDNGWYGEDQDVLMYLSSTENEVSICLLGSKDYFTSTLTGTYSMPLADATAIGPFVETSSSGMIQTNLFLKGGSLPPIDASNLVIEKRKSLKKR